MGQFRILGFFYEMVLQFKEDKTIFTMSVHGTLRPLLEEPVVSFHINENHIAFLYLKDVKYRIAIFEYKNKALSLKCDIDAKINRGSIKSAGFRILNSNKHQIILSDTETLWTYFYEGLFVDWWTKRPHIKFIFPFFKYSIHFIY